MVDLSLLRHLYLWSSDQVIDDIIRQYRDEKSLIVDYLYFAQAMRFRLFEGTPTAIQTAYHDALTRADFLLPDGIALQLFYRWTIWRKEKITPTNLNGTDLCPKLLHTLVDTYGASQIHVAVFNVWDEKIGKDESYLAQIVSYIKATFMLDVDVARQCHYTERESSDPWNIYETSLKETKKSVRILLNFIWAPYQEIMTHQKRAFVDDHHLLVLNQWWTIDFRTGVETRAPRRIVRARVLETPRRILKNPQKNLRKFFWMFGIIRILFSIFLLKLHHR